MSATGRSKTTCGPVDEDLDRKGAHLSVQLFPFQVRGGHGEVVKDHKLLGLFLESSRR